MDVRGEQAGVIVAFPGVGGLVDSPDGFFSVPCELNLAARSSAREQAGQSLLALVVDPFVSEGERGCVSGRREPLICGGTVF